jgi:hypothetical protein
VFKGNTCRQCRRRYHDVRMPKEYINPPSLFRSRDNGFSQAVAASGTRTLYVSTTWIGVVSLADPGFLIEVEATAVLE